MLKSRFLATVQTRSWSIYSLLFRPVLLEVWYQCKLLRAGVLFPDSLVFALYKSKSFQIITDYSLYILLLSKTYYH